VAISAAVAVALAPNAAPADVAYAKSGVVYLADASGALSEVSKPIFQSVISRYRLTLLRLFLCRATAAITEGRCIY
jgi:hypothetical protein